MAEIDINGRHYLTGKLSTHTQLQIVKRFAPAALTVVPALLRWRAEARGQVIDGAPDFTGVAAGVGITQGILPDGLTPSRLVEITGLISNVLPSLSDDDMFFVIDACLEQVRFQNTNGGWAPLKPAGSRLVMLDEADNIGVQIKLTSAVLWENLESFTLETLLPSPNGVLMPMAA